MVAGDTIGYRIATSDWIFGSGRVAVSGFSAPDDSAVPEPSAVCLFALGAAGLLAFRLRRPNLR